MKRADWGLTSHEGRALTEAETCWAILAGLGLALVLLRIADVVAGWCAR